MFDLRNVPELPFSASIFLIRNMLVWVHHWNKEVFVFWLWKAKLIGLARSCHMFINTVEVSIAFLFLEPGWMNFEDIAFGWIRQNWLCSHILRFVACRASSAWHLMLREASFREFFLFLEFLNMFAAANRNWTASTSTRELRSCLK